MKYQEKVKLHFKEVSQANVQEQWVVNACTQATKEVLGYSANKTKKILRNEQVDKLSAEQKEIRLKHNATKNMELRQKLQKSRNDKLKELRLVVRQIKEEKLLEDISEIENSKDDSSRMYKAVRQLNRSKPKSKILVETDDGVTANESEASEIITKFFENVYNSNNQKIFLR